MTTSTRRISNNKRTKKTGSKATGKASRKSVAASVPNPVHARTRGRAVQTALASSQGLGGSGKDTTSTGVVKTSKVKIPAPNLPPSVTAIALSGGGAKGSFQLGALKYLYERVFSGDEPLPMVMSGTSVGAVNAAKLAEGGKGAFTELEKIWMSLQHDWDMYEEHDWVKTLSSVLRNMFRIAGSDGLAFTEILGLAVGYIISDDLAGVDTDKITSAVSRAEEAKAVYHLGPLAKIIDGGLDINKVLASKIKLRLAVVNLLGGQLRYVTEKGQILERDNKTTVKWPGVVGKGQWGRGEPWYPKPCGDIAKQVARDINAIPRPEKTPSNHPDKKELDDYNAQVSEAMKPLHQCLKSKSLVHLKYGVLASSAIPTVFDPGRLFGTEYVDGGVREVVPVEIAIDCGADKVYAVVCARKESAPPPYIKNLPTVGLRALDITLDEVILNETSRIPAWADKPVVIIRPRLEVHDALTIEPGLIRISAAYGYMCAADTIELAGDEVKRNEAMALADQITRYRLTHWNGEKSSADHRESVKFKTTKQEEAIVSALSKHDVRQAAKERLAKGYSLPPHIERAWMNWECHRLAQFYPVLWPEFDFSNIPEACNGLKKTLEGLENQKAALVDEIAKQTDKPQKGGQPTTKDLEVKKVDELIDQAREKLGQCIRNVLLDPRSHGLLIKSKGSKDVFVLYGGSKLLLRGSDPMKEMHYNPTDIVEIPAEALARLPIDRPADGTVLGNRKGDVFIMKDGKKKNFTITVPKFYDPAKYDSNFTPLEKEAREIRLVPAETLNHIP